MHCVRGKHTDAVHIDRLLRPEVCALPLEAHVLSKHTVSVSGHNNHPPLAALACAPKSKHSAAVILSTAMFCRSRREREGSL